MKKYYEIDIKDLKDFLKNLKDYKGLKLKMENNIVKVEVQYE